MPNNVDSFDKIAPYLTHPLVLIGFVVMIFFSIHRQLLKAGIIPTMDQHEGTYIVRLLLRYGFWIGLLVILSGFGLEFYKLKVDNEIKHGLQEEKVSANIEKLVETLVEKQKLEVQDKNVQIRGLTKAITDLRKGRGVVANTSEVNSAITALTKEDTSQAKELFSEAIHQSELKNEKNVGAIQNLEALKSFDSIIKVGLPKKTLNASNNLPDNRLVTSPSLTNDIGNNDRPDKPKLSELFKLTQNQSPASYSITEKRRSNSQNKTAPTSADNNYGYTALSQYASAQADPLQMLAGMIGQVQTGMLTPEWYGQELLQEITFQTQGSFRYQPLAQLGPVRNVVATQQLHLPQGWLFAMIAHHYYGHSTWLMGVSSITNQIEYANFNVVSLPTPSSSSIHEPNPTHVPAPFPESDSEACQKFPNLC